MIVPGEIVRAKINGTIKRQEREIERESGECNKKRIRQSDFPTLEMCATKKKKEKKNVKGSLDVFNLLLLLLLLQIFWRREIIIIIIICRYKSLRVAAAAATCLSLFIFSDGALRIYTIL